MATATEALGAIAEIVMGQSPPGETCNETGQGLPLLNGPTEFGAHHPTPVQFTTSSRKTARRGDILFCVRGSTTGRMNWADREYAIGRGTAAIRHKGGQEFQPFLRALIEYHLPELLAQATGSTFPNVSYAQLWGLRSELPSEREQRAIARIFGALDDKIELNRELNETLEVVVRAIFKSWFVDFDPVRAKAQGRQPAGMDQATAALFPKSFEDSQLGNIPTGWRSGTLGEVLSELETGSRPRGGVGGFLHGVPSIGAESIVGLGQYDFSKTKYVPNEYYANMTKGRVKSRDVLLYKDGGRPGEYEPHVAMFGDGFPFGDVCINEHVYRLRANNLGSQPFLYFWLTSESALDEMRAKGTGVAVPGLNSTALRSLTTVIPNVEVTRQFEAVAEPYLAALLNRCNESRTLAAIRDALLPKLLSGEIRAKDAEKLVGAAT